MSENAWKKKKIRELIKRKWVSLLVNRTPSKEDKEARQILQEAGYYVNTILTEGV